MGMKTSVRKMEQYIENSLGEWNVPGGAIAIVDHGELISSRGYGVREKGKPDTVDTDTYFPIGSCSKAFTATVLGKLVDDGKLNWDDKINKFLPDFKMIDPWMTEHVTVRDMLSHRTGTKRCIRLMNRDKVFDINDYIERMAYLQMDKEFRTGFGYNNPHYIIPGKVAEVVSGKAWNELVHEYIFDPLHMKHSMATYREMLRRGVDNVASPHANPEGGFVPAELRVLDPVEPISWTDYGHNPAGSIISNLTDMTKWLQMILNEGTFDDTQLFKSETIAEMTSPQMVIKPGESEMDALFAVGLPTNLLSYGLGWYIMDFRGYKMVFHPGQVHGFVSAVAFLPQLKIGGVVLLNTYQTMLHAMLGFYIFDALLGHEEDYSRKMKAMVPQWRAGAEMQISGMLAQRPDDLKPLFPDESLAGKYVSDLYGDIVISVEDGKLMYRYGETELFVAELELWEETTYITQYENKVNPMDFVTFIPDEQGNIARLAVKDIDIFIRD